MAQNLGFADLTEDESLLVSVYRAWRESGQAKVTAERAIAHALAHDSIHPALSAAFALFEAMDSRQPGLAGRSALLTLDEERLLWLLTPGRRQNAPRGKGSPRDPARWCRKALDDARQNVRPLPAIARSGRDALEEKVAKASVARAWLL
ncbi:MAG: hypothetical protein AAF761_05215 [Pseudomonadota bacterium]